MADSAEPDLDLVKTLTLYLVTLLMSVSLKFEIIILYRF